MTVRVEEGAYVAGLFKPWSAHAVSFRGFRFVFCSPLLASLFAMQPELCISFQAGLRLADDFGASAELLEVGFSVNSPRPWVRRRASYRDFPFPGSSARSLFPSNDHPVQFRGGDPSSTNARMRYSAQVL